jgi:hypothetical protein
MGGRKRLNPITKFGYSTIYILFIWMRLFRFGARTLSVLLPVICNEVPTHLKKSRGKVELKNKIKKFYIM